MVLEIQPVCFAFIVWEDVFAVLIGYTDDEQCDGTKLIWNLDSP